MVNTGGQGPVPRYLPRRAGAGDPAGRLDQAINGGISNMFRKIAAFAATMLFAAASFAAVDANKGTEAELDGLKGVGPSLSKRILEERKQGEFKDWADFMQRVKGVKEKSAAKLSAEGLTVNGKSFPGAEAPAAKPAAPPAVPAKSAAKP